MTNQLHLKYSLCRRAKSELPEILLSFLKKYPSAGAVGSKDVGAVTHYYWKTQDGSLANLFVRSDGGAEISFTAKEESDTGNKNLMMKLVSIGYRTSDVQIREAVVSLLAELLDA